MGLSRYPPQQQAAIDVAKGLAEDVSPEAKSRLASAIRAVTPPAPPFTLTVSEENGQKGITVTLNPPGADADGADKIRVFVYGGDPSVMQTDPLHAGGQQIYYDVAINLGSVGTIVFIPKKSGKTKLTVMEQFRKAGAPGEDDELVGTRVFDWDLIVAKAE